MILRKTHKNEITDFIQFRLSFYSLKVDMQNLLFDVFGISTQITKDCHREHFRVEHDYTNPEANYLTIICRPEQFARFIVLRNSRGMKNGIKCLDAKLYRPLPPEPKREVVRLVDATQYQA